VSDPPVPIFLTNDDGVFARKELQLFFSRPRKWSAFTMLPPPCVQKVDEEPPLMDGLSRDFQARHLLAHALTELIVSSGGLRGDINRAHRVLGRGVIHR